MSSRSGCHCHQALGGVSAGQSRSQEEDSPTIFSSALSSTRLSSGKDISLRGRGELRAPTFFPVAVERSVGCVGAKRRTDALGDMVEVEEEDDLDCGNDAFSTT
jgi:hypothetical protein